MANSYDILHSQIATISENVQKVYDAEFQKHAVEINTIIANQRELIGDAHTSVLGKAIVGKMILGGV